MEVMVHMVHLKSCSASFPFQYSLLCVRRGSFSWHTGKCHLYMHAEFCWGNRKHLHFIPLLCNRMAQVVETFPCGRQGSDYPAKSILRPLILWWREGICGHLIDLILLDIPAPKGSNYTVSRVSLQIIIVLMIFPLSAHSALLSRE